MSHAVWVILYTVAEADRQDYIDWFHQVHIPDKLARPGYEWAAHYAGPPSMPGGARDYVALFGATATRTFLDPSPAQLRPRQDALGRQMMGHRQRARAFVACEEWRLGDEAQGVPVRAPALRLSRLAAAAEDEDLGAWLVQSRAPARLARPGCLGVRKWLATCGPLRHLWLEEYADVAEAAAVDADPAPDRWTLRTASYLSEDDGPTTIAAQIWPPR